jgi:hypothetical protein
VTGAILCFLPCLSPLDCCSGLAAVDRWGGWFLFGLFAAILVWEEVRVWRRLPISLLGPGLSGGGLGWGFGCSSTPFTVVLLLLLLVCTPIACSRTPCSTAASGGRYMAAAAVP